MNALLAMMLFYDVVCNLPCNIAPDTATQSQVALISTSSGQVDSNTSTELVSGAIAQTHLLEPVNWSTEPLSAPTERTFTPDAEYINPPQVAPDDQIDPATTTLPLNDTLINHLTNWGFSTGRTFADTLNSDSSLNATIKLGSQITESLSQSNVYTVDQQGSYLQFTTVPYTRIITTTRTEPQTMIGLEMQMSLVGACILPGSSENQTCTYTPGIVTDRNSIDPEFFVPTRVFQTSRVGDVVSPESLAVMQLPGFQRGANNQEIGLDLYFPNLGSFPRNNEGDRTLIQRDENLNLTLASTFSQIRQVVRANDTEAVLGRTTRGTTILVDDEHRLLNTALQLGAQLLPDVIPPIEGSENPVNSDINVNLFLAANNTRLPVSSFTIYSAGLGRAISLTPDMTNSNHIPRANYNSLWLGLSPVIDRSFTPGETFYRPTTPSRLITSAGGEGGANSNVALLSAVNKDIFSTENLQNFYAQIYLKFLATDVDYVTQTIYQEKTQYYPHLSFTGNFTGAEDVFRYYTGIIASNSVKGYLGADYTRNTNSGWNFNIGGVGYFNPDRDYYSQLWGNATKTINLGSNANLVLATGLNYGLDRENRIGDVVSISPASSLTASAALNWGIMSFGLTNYFGNLLPNSFDNKLLMNLTLNPTDHLSLSAYYAPIDQNESRSQYGASLAWRISDSKKQPTLSLDWQNQQYDYGSDPFSNSLSINDNIFTILFRMKN